MSTQGSNPEAELWASDPTWANHLALFPAAGITMHAYPYFDAGNSSLRFDEMMQALKIRNPGDVVLFHACCHNPCGVSPTPAQWQAIANLVAELYASMADRSENKVIRKYVAYDCLVIDEVGYIEVEPTQVGLFFTLMQKRHKNKPTLLTSNLGFSEWSSFLKNKHLTAALIDRLTENSHVINMKNCKTLRGKLDDQVKPEDSEPSDDAGSEPSDDVSSDPSEDAESE